MVPFFIFFWQINVDLERLLSSAHMEGNDDLSRKNAKLPKCEVTFEGWDTSSERSLRLWPQQTPNSDHQFTEFRQSKTEVWSSSNFLHLKKGIDIKHTHTLTLPPTKTSSPSNRFLWQEIKTSLAFKTTFIDCLSSYRYPNNASIKDFKMLSFATPKHCQIC